MDGDRDWLLRGGADVNALMSSVSITGQMEARNVDEMRSSKTRRKR